ncbi:hypothetical protein SDJN02_09465, partial [Cucurbita argyrosperma subsp. argyrosperma]
MAEAKDSGAHMVEILDEQDNQNRYRNLMISRDEHLFGLRIGHRETKLECLKQQIFQLCCYFFLFNVLSLTLMFTSYNPNVCHKWWGPAVSVAATSVVFVMAVQVKLWEYWKAAGELQRERMKNRAVIRCVQELRMKSSSVEIKWGPLTCLSRNCITISLLCFSGLVFAASKFILCGFLVREMLRFCIMIDDRRMYGLERDLLWGISV